MILDEKFFDNFVEEFYEGIENYFRDLLKKEKKLSVGKFSIDAIDYMDGSKTPILDTVKENSEREIKIYFRNNEGSPTAYSVEEIFHPFSLAALGDTLLGRKKYVKILEDFYVNSEKIVLDYLKEKEIEQLNIEEEEFPILAVTSADGKFSLVEGNCKSILIKNDRIFFEVACEDEENKLVHIVEGNAADIASILKNKIV